MQNQFVALALEDDFLSCKTQELPPCAEVQIASRTLLIVDLNGIMVYRQYSIPQKDEKLPPGALRVGNFIMWKRPGYEEFIEMIFKHFDVAVWSSVNSYNITAMTQEIFGKRENDLVFIWDQKKCQAVEHPLFDHKKLYLKNLSEVWKAFPQYNRNNTLIIDDTDLKMRNNPRSCVVLAQPWDRAHRWANLDIGHGVMREIAYRVLFS